MKSSELARVDHPPVPTTAPRVPARSRRATSRDELAFLPAALEIVETPPSPIGRAIAITIIVLFCAALAWASWGHVDIVASATGKIVPNGRTKVDPAVRNRHRTRRSACRTGRRSRPATC